MQGYCEVALGDLVVAEKLGKRGVFGGNVTGGEAVARFIYI